MPRYDIQYQAFRREQLHKLSSMDPYDLVCELGVTSEEVLDKFWELVENRIESEYNEEDDIESDYDGNDELPW